MPRESFTPSGIIRDLPATEIDPNIYTAGNNVVFREGLAEAADKGVEVFQGTAASPGNAALGPPMNLVNTSTFEGNFWLYPHDNDIATGWAVTDGTLHKDITPTGFAPWIDPRTNPFTDGNIGGFPYLNWGPQMGVWQRNFATPGLIDILQGLDDQDPPVASAAWVPVCQAMRTHQNRIMCLSTRDDPGTHGFPSSEEAVVWSSLPDPALGPAVWDFFPRIDNSAGSAELSGGGPVIDGASLRSSFVVYLSNRVYIMDEIGGTFVFAIRKMSTSTGVLSRNCIAQTPGAHYVLSGDDFYRNDGQSIESVIDNVNKKSLFLSMGNNFQAAQCTYNAARNEVWVLTPEGNDTYPSHAWVYDLGTQKFGEISFTQPNSSTPRQIPGSTIGPIPFPSASSSAWDGQDPLIWGVPEAPTGDDISRIWNQATEQSALPVLTLADPDFDTFANPKFIATLSIVEGDSGQLYQVPLAQRQDLDLGDDSRLKIVTGFWPRVQAGSAGTSNRSMFLRIGSRDGLGAEPIVWSPTINFRSGPPQRVDVPFIQGRYISVEISRFGNELQGWRVNGFDLEFEMAGEF